MELVQESWSVLTSMVAFGKMLGLARQDSRSRPFSVLNCQWYSCILCHDVKTVISWMYFLVVKIVFAFDVFHTLVHSVRRTTLAGHITYTWPDVALTYIV